MERTGEHDGEKKDKEKLVQVRKTGREVKRNGNKGGGRKRKEVDTSKDHKERERRMRTLRFRIQRKRRAGEPDQPERIPIHEENRPQRGEDKYCALCDIWLNGPTQWEYHLQEDKHKRRKSRLRRQKAQEGRQTTDGGEEVEGVGPRYNAQEGRGKTVADFAQPNPEDLGEINDFDDTGGWAPDSIEMKHKKTG